MNNEKSTSRRERRIAARKEQILQAAAEVFREKGYGRATTKEIADAADVSEGTLYNYFNNKRELLIGLVQDFTNETIADIAEIQAEGIEDLMIQVMVSRLKKMRHKRLITLFLHEARMDPEIHQYYVEEMLGRFIHELEERLRALINAGIMRPINPAITARVIVSAMTGLAIIFDVGDDTVVQEMSDEELAKEMLNFFKHGLYPCPPTEKGRA
ncbi:MAG: TetR/AcrR family transcriptional regulator [Anaerolineae bacterium]|nr:TetR/AcrR family transcriptional regulator [Anaerolineae bacterium]